MKTPVYGTSNGKNNTEPNKNVNPWNGSSGETDRSNIKYLRCHEYGYFMSKYTNFKQKSKKVFSTVFFNGQRINYQE